jgi:hypothetical protein
MKFTITTAMTKWNEAKAAKEAKANDTTTE